jgi:hypothetical protein
MVTAMRVAVAVAVEAVRVGRILTTYLQVALVQVADRKGEEVGGRIPALALIVVEAPMEILEFPTLPLADRARPVSGMLW